MSRFLTPHEKRRELSEWRRLCASGRMTGPGEGGRGYPDADMILWCARLNAIRGVCTVQSCAGHGSVERGEVGSSGHLWLRLSREMAEAFDAHAFRLAANDHLIEQVARIYAPWGKEIALVAFAGNERNSLHRSMRLIVAFLRTLRAKRTTPNA